MAAIMTLLSHGQWDFAAVRFPALGAISQIFLPYRLPRPHWIPEVELGLYQNVIRGACRLLDQMLSRLVQAAGDNASVLNEGLPAGIWALLPRAELCIAKRDFREARSLVTEAWNSHPTHPDALRRLGLLLLRLRDWNALADLAKQALKLDDNDALAWLGLAEAQLRKQLAAEAEEAALRAIGLNYYLAQAHFVLARAFIAQGKWQQARDTMQTIQMLQPSNRAAAAYAKRMGAAG